MIIYLYVKTHNRTKLKYLGKTTKRDPHKYHGSGADWKLHLKEYGMDYTTEIIRECQSKQELNQWGRYYSNLWNVVESTGWANRIPETGGGQCSPEAALKISNALKGRKKPPRSKEHTEKQAATTRGQSNPKTSEGLRKWHGSAPDRSISINKQSKSLKEWYRNNPERSHNKSLKTWDGIYKKDYEKYKLAVTFISEGKNNREIIKLMQIDYATINKLRTMSHRIFELFPSFKQLINPKVF